MTLAATLTTDKIGDTISGDGSGALMHGPTFMGNPLACACANASLELLINNGWQKQVSNIEKTLKRELQSCREFKHVADVRVLGAIGVVELSRAVDMKKIQKAFISEGVWIRPFGKLVYIMPPYIISEEDLQSLCLGMKNVLQASNSLF